MKIQRSKFIQQAAALVIAIILWLYVMGTENPQISETYTRVNINLLNSDQIERKGLKLMSTSNERVNVLVSGKKNDLSRLDNKNIEATVDLTGVNEGDNKIRVNAVLKGANSGVSIDKVEPQDIVVVIDSVVSVPKKVVVNVKGDVKQSYILDTPVPSLPNINVKGPKTWVSEVDHLEAEVDADGLTKTSSLNATVRAVREDGTEVEGVEPAIRTISVDMPVYATKKIAIKPEIGTKLDENFTYTDLVLDPSEILVKSKGSLESIDNISTEPIDMTKFINGDRQKVNLVFPKGVSSVDNIQEITVSTNVKQMISKTFEYKLDKEDILNIPEDLKLSDENWSAIISISFRGAKDVIEKLTAQDIEVHIDLKDGKIGANYAAVKIVEIPNAYTSKISPENVEVTLVKKAE